MASNRSEAQISVAPTPPATSLPNLVSKSAAMRKVYTTIRQVAASDATICIYGESGTGKELVARAIHALSHRRNSPLVVFDSTAVPEGLAESEMFGHEHGSFTGAVSSRQGVFELADTGTLFLDEVGELSLPIQAKLLRVIQSREFRRVGGTRPLKVDVRLITATNRDILKMVAARQFREDLLYRLMVIPITLPPLRKRIEDIPLLTAHFLERFNRQGRKRAKKISDEALNFLSSYSWPGNVRELENCIERAAVTSTSEVIKLRDIRLISRDGSLGNSDRTLRSPLLPLRLADLEREHALEVLRTVNGDRTKAAELLGLSLRGLYYKIRRWDDNGISVPPPPNPAPRQLS